MSTSSGNRSFLVLKVSLECTAPRSTRRRDPERELHCAAVAVRVGGDVCIVHFAAAKNTREYRKNAGAEQTLLKHMLSTTSTYLPPMALNPNLDGLSTFYTHV